MGAFLSRFWLDAQNSDLNAAIKTKTAQVEVQADFEKQFRNTQSKLNIFKLITQSANPTDKIALLTSSLPSDVNLSTITIQDSSTEVKGSAGSEIGIAQFISNLKAEKSFKSVDLGQVNSSENNPSLTIFTIKISY